MNFKKRISIAYFFSTLPFILSLILIKQRYIELRKMNILSDTSLNSKDYLSASAFLLFFYLLLFFSKVTAEYFSNIYKENQIRFNNLNINDEENKKIKSFLFDISFILTPVGCLIFMIILKLIRVFGFDNLKYPKLHKISCFSWLLYIAPIFWLPTILSIFAIIKIFEVN